MHIAYSSWNMTNTKYTFFQAFKLLKSVRVMKPRFRKVELVTGMSIKI